MPWNTFLLQKGTYPLTTLASHHPGGHQLCTKRAGHTSHVHAFAASQGDNAFDVMNFAKRQIRDRDNSIERTVQGYRRQSPREQPTSYRDSLCQIALRSTLPTDPA